MLYAVLYEAAEPHSPQQKGGNWTRYTFPECMYVNDRASGERVVYISDKFDTAVIRLRMVGGGGLSFLTTFKGQ